MPQKSIQALKKIPAYLILISSLLPVAQANTDLFNPYLSLPTGSWPEAVDVGDVNGDGRNDVVLTTSFYFDPENDYKLFVFLQDEQGQLSAPIKYSTVGSYTARPQTVAIGDYNNDSLLDVAVGHDRAYIEIFTQNSAGTFDLSTTIPSIYSTKIRSADLNNDGLTDIAGIGWGGSDAAVYLQLDNGTFDLAQTYYAPHGGYDDLELGDINNDGLNDIIVMSGQAYAYDNIAVLTQNISGSFDPVVPYDIGGNELTRGTTIGDLNGDGLNDIAVSYGGNRPNSHVALFSQNSTGTLEDAISHTSLDIPEPVHAADVNLDGLDDLVVLHGGWVSMGVYLQQADGQLAPESLYTIPYASHYNPHGLAVGDINSDGSPDVVIADSNNGLVVLSNTLVAVNTPPVADAGSDATIKQRKTFTLDAANSYDTDGSIVSYSWRQLSGKYVQLQSGDTASSMSFRAPKLRGRRSEALLFEVTVEDDKGDVSSDQVTITVVKNLE